jgi:DNA-binding Lrp family transcriptional regulator
MARGVVSQVIEELLESEPRLTTKEVADRAGVSRQAAQKQLKLLVSSGVLTVEGKARAAKYRRPDADVRALKAKVSDLAELLRFKLDDPKPTVVVDSRPVVIPAKVDDSARPVAKALVDDSRRPANVLPLPKAVHLGVAETGALYRLSGRLLLQDVAADIVTLDFTGVMEASEEFLEEVFLRWADANPLTVLRAVNVPDALRERVQKYLAR